MAAAHLSLPHTLVRGLFTGCMVQYPQDKHLAKLSTKIFEVNGFDLNGPPEENGGASSCFAGKHEPPVFLHYCRRYAFENPNKTSLKKGRDRQEKEPLFYFVAKRRVPHDILDDCGSNNDGKATGLRFLTPFTSTKEEKIDGGRMDWTMLIMCSVLRAVNYAKSSYCAVSLRKNQHGKPNRAALP